MAGLPWLIVFALLSAWSLFRGHRPALVATWLICFGIGAGNTDVGQGFYDIVTMILATVWNTLVTALQRMAA